jgi:hypothetical protein
LSDLKLELRKAAWWASKKVGLKAYLSSARQLVSKMDTLWAETKADLKADRKAEMREHPLADL